MSASDPNQLNLQDDHPEFGRVPESSATDYLDTPDTDLDKYVQKMGVSYDVAKRRLGIATDDLPVEEPAKGPERKKRAKVVVANELGERAMHLLKAANDYQESVKAEALMHELLAKGDEESSDRFAQDHVIFESDGDREFYKSWYANGLKKSKLDTVEERFAAKEAREDFFDLSTNPDRTDELSALGESLDHQINWVRAKKAS